MSWRRGLLTLGLASLFAGVATAQADTKPVRFADPVRLAAGDKLLGEGRYFPSPAVHDVNGDGKLDVVIGDLMGRPTVALREERGDALALGAEATMNGADGEPINFHNW